MGVLSRSSMKQYIVCLSFVLVSLYTAPSEAQCSGTPSQFIRNICEPCAYCQQITNNIQGGCESGCRQCSSCLAGGVLNPLGSLRDYWNLILMYRVNPENAANANCKYCTAGESERKCVKRCVGGCNICQGKGGKGLKTCAKYEGCF